MGSERGRRFFPEFDERKTRRPKKYQRGATLLSLKMRAMREGMRQTLEMGKMGVSEFFPKTSKRNAWTPVQ